eukprot:RCo021221
MGTTDGSLSPMASPTPATTALDEDKAASGTSFGAPPVDGGGGGNDPEPQAGVEPTPAPQAHGNNESSGSGGGGNSSREAVVVVPPPLVIPCSGGCGEPASSCRGGGCGGRLQDLLPPSLPIGHGGLSHSESGGAWVGPCSVGSSCSSSESPLMVSVSTLSSSTYSRSPLSASTTTDHPTTTTPSHGVALQLPPSAAPHCSREWGDSPSESSSHHTLTVASCHSSSSGGSGAVTGASASASSSTAAAVATVRLLTEGTTLGESALPPTPCEASA